MFIRQPLALLAAATLVTTALLGAASLGPGFGITTDPGDNPGSGLLIAKVTAEHGIENSIIARAVMNGGGTFENGQTVWEFDLKGGPGDQITSVVYVCATESSTITILDVNGGEYIAATKADFRPGECGDIETPVDGDDDVDGVNNSVDQCPNTPAGVVVDKATGCEPVVVNTDADGDGFDGDGLSGGSDQCPNSTSNAQVNENGCTIGLKPTVTSNNHTPAQDGVDGTTTVTVNNPNQVDITYQVTVGGKSYEPLTVLAQDEASFDVTLPQGVYPSAVRAAGSNAQFDVVIGYLPPVLIGVVVTAPVPDIATMTFTVADQEGVEWQTPDGTVVSPGVHAVKWGESFKLTPHRTSKQVTLSGATEWIFSFPGKPASTVKPTQTQQPTVAPTTPATVTATTPAKPAAVAPTQVAKPAQQALPQPAAKKTEKSAVPDYKRGISTDTAAAPAAKDSSFGWGISIVGLIAIGLLLIPIRRRQHAK